MMKRLLVLCGVLATVVYVFTVIFGGALWPEYSHIAQPVSDLIAADAPNKALLDPFFGLYNLLTILFGWGMFQSVRASQENRAKRLGLLGAIVLIAEGLFGILVLFFPEDAGGMTSGTMSTTGVFHIVFSGLCSLTTMAAILLMGFWFKSQPRLNHYGLYSFISVAVVFVSGGMTAASIPAGNSIGGLLERLTMGAWLQWMFVIGAGLYAFAKSAAPVQKRRSPAGKKK